MPELTVTINFVDVNNLPGLMQVADRMIREQLTVIKDSVSFYAESEMKKVIVEVNNMAS